MLLTNLISFIKNTQQEKDGKVFPWTDEGLAQYLAWAFSLNYLFIDYNEKGISGCLVAYPLHMYSDGTVDSLLPNDCTVGKQTEHLKELCLMDAIARSPESRIKIMREFCNRFPNWKSQKKWAVRKGKVVELKNKYIELTTLNFNE